MKFERKTSIKGAAFAKLVKISCRIFYSSSLHALLVLKDDIPYIKTMFN